MFLFSIFYLISDKQEIDKEALEVETSVQKQQLIRLSKKTVKVAEALRLKKRLTEILADIKVLKESLEDTSYFYDQLRSKLPGDVWLTSTKEASDFLVITGTASSQPSLAVFLENLKTHEKFSSIDLIESTRIRINNDNYYSYIIHANYKKENGKK